MGTKTAIVYHSGFGHTTKVAEAVAEGVKQFPGAEAHVIRADTLTDADWATLDAADAIVFGKRVAGIAARFAKTA
jgi:multimeric flavodoxin WrbA